MHQLSKVAYFPEAGGWDTLPVINIFDVLYSNNSVVELIDGLVDGAVGA